VRGSYKETLKENIVLKYARIRIRTGGEAFRATARRPKFGTFYDESSPLGK